MKVAGGGMRGTTERSGKRFRGSVWALLLLLALPSLAAETLPGVDISNLEQVLLRAPVEYRVEERPETHFQEVQTQPFSALTDRDINQGVSTHAYWLRVRLRNSGEQPVTWVLSHETSYLDNMDIYYRGLGDKQYQKLALSDRIPFHERPVDYRNLSFRHTTPAHSHTDLYIKSFYQKADAVSLNFILREEGVFLDNLQREHFLYGIYYGVLFSLIGIALIISLVIRKTSALIYALLLTVTATKWLLFNGYGFQYLWPNNVFWHNEGFHIIFLLFAICGLEFSKTFLKTKRYYPRVSQLFSALQLLSGLAIGLRLAGFYEPILHASFLMLAILAVVIPLVSWAVWRRGCRYARWYLSAWLVYSATLLLALVSAYTSLLSWGMQPLLILQLGSLLEASLLMVALAEGLLGLEKDRRQALALANQDHLTGLGNRRALQIEYEKFAQRYHLDQKPVFLIMIDLDHFKVINDTHGHDAGDEVLKEIAALLKSYSRETDVCIRYGGEEFALLLCAENVDEVRCVADRIRIEFAQNPTTYRGKLIEHTLSSGITPVLCEREILTVNEMMQRADAALYRGKAAGRNQNIVHGEVEAEVDVEPLAQA